MRCSFFALIALSVLSFSGCRSIAESVFCSIFDIEKEDKRPRISDDDFRRRGIEPDSQESKRFQAKVDAYNDIGQLANQPRSQPQPTFRPDIDELSSSDESWRKNAQ